MIKITAFIFLCLLNLQVQAQSSAVIDSLKCNIDAHSTADSFRVKAIYQYLRATIYNSSENKPYINEMLAISRKINYSYGITKGFSLFVKYYGDRGDFQKSFLYADSLSAFLKNDTSYVANRARGILYWDMANNYIKIGDYNKSIEYYFLAVSVFEKFGDYNYLCSLYSNISDVYSNTSDSVKSMEYIRKALVAAEKSDSYDTKCFALLNYATELTNRKKADQARQVLDKVEPIVQRLKNSSYSQHYFYGRGLVSVLNKEFKEAIVHLKKSLQFARTNDDVHQVTGVMKELFDCFITLNDFSESKIYLDSTLLLAKNADLKKRRKEVYDGYAVWYEKKGDYKNSNKYFQKSIALNDSILSEEKNEQITSLEIRYQVAGKESEIRNLKTEKELQQLSIRQKSMLNYILMGGAISILIIALMSYRNYRHKQSLQQQRISELETEKQLMATEAVLKGEEKERSRIAKDLHDGLGGMLSGIKYSFNTMKENLVMTPENHQTFERSMDMLDSSIKEMRRVAHNMMPESLVRFGLNAALQDFCNDINQSGALHITYQSLGVEQVKLNQTISIAVYRIVQELINNTMKHSGARTAIVQISEADDQLSITVEDDGKGFDIALLNRAEGMGWSNIKSRVDFLKGQIDVRSDSATGTSVHIDLKV